MRPLYQPIVYTGDGVPITSDAYLYAMERYKVGDIVRHEVGAPGIGYVEYEITRMDDSGVYARMVESTVRILEPWEVI